MRVVVLGRTPGRTLAVRTLLGQEELHEDTKCCKHTAEIAGRKVGDGNEIIPAESAVICSPFLIGDKQLISETPGHKEFEHFI